MHALSIAVVALASVLTLPVAMQETFKQDAEGFIRNWLVLAPIPLEGDATGIDHEFLKGEASVKPKAGDTASVGGKSLTWTDHQTSDFFIDFRQSFDPNGGENVVGYAVTYILADDQMGLTLSLGTNDQGKAWLNGKEVFKFDGERTLEKDTDRMPVTLVKGQNVLVLKIGNVVNNWQACARFMRGEAPVTNLKISLTPQ